MDDSTFQAVFPRAVVSVVIPTRGRPRQLRGCLEALAAQTLPRDDFEVIVVDDGSPEPCADPRDDFAGRLNVRLVRQEHAGPAAARNRGVAQATGTLVAFTDDDCLPAADWLEMLVAGERGRPGAIVGGSTVNGLRDMMFSETSQWIVDMIYEHFNRDRDNAYFFTSNNMLCNRERYLALGGFDVRFPWAAAEDRDFCDRWRSAGWPLVWRPQATIEHRHPQTLRKFLGMYYRYGRGAYLYHSHRRERSPAAADGGRNEFSFHITLPRRVWNGLDRQRGILRKMQFCVALVIWQAANAVGFFRQSLSPRPAACRRP